MVSSVDFNIAEINNTPKVWGIIDFALLWKAKGIEDYAELLEFRDRHGLSITTAIAIMSGHSRSGSQGVDAFKDGRFKVRDREFAEIVAYTYSSLSKLSKHVRSNQFQMAVSAVCLVSNFDPGRLIRNANKCTEKLQARSTRESFLQDLEEIYNFGIPSRRWVPLKIEAVKELSRRNFAKSSKKAA